MFYAAYLTKRETETIIGGIICFVVLIAISIFSVYLIMKEYKKRKLQKEEELENELLKQKIQEQKEKERQEYINNSLCVICQKHSYGYDICQNCVDRSEILFQEIPGEALISFDTIYDFYCQIKNKIIFAKNKHERETNSIRIIAVASYMETKYLYRDSLKEIELLFKELKDNDYEASKNIIKKYSTGEEDELL